MSAETDHEQTPAGAMPAGSNSSSEGTEVLDGMLTFLKRFVAYPSEHEAVAHVLWIAHTHAMDAWESTPRLAFLSPEPGSGKSRALEMTELLVPRPVASVNVSPSYLFRKVSDEAGPPTILFDEIDTVFGPKARDNEDIRGFLNAGHRRGATAGRCVVVGNTVKTEELPAYCAVAVAGLGNLPDTILTRSVIIRMRRRAPNERVEPFRRRLHESEGFRLLARLAHWTSNEAQSLGAARPEMPEGVEDRAADVWEPLLAIADAAGGSRPTKGRDAASMLVRGARDSSPSLGLRLLADLRQAFGSNESLPSKSLIAALVGLEDAPWGDMRGKELDSRMLANLLRQYGVQPKTIRVGLTTFKGYVRVDLLDTWTRYLPAHSSAESETPVTAETLNALWPD